MFQIAKLQYDNRALDRLTNGEWLREILCLRTVKFVEVVLCLGFRWGTDENCIDVGWANPFVMVDYLCVMSIMVIVFV